MSIEHDGGNSLGITFHADQRSSSTVDEILEISVERAWKSL